MALPLRLRRCSRNMESSVPALRRLSIAILSNSTGTMNVLTWMAWKPTANAIRFLIPSPAPALFGICLSQPETDAQLQTQPDFCIPPDAGPPPFPGAPSQFGVDHLNNLGPTPIPANSAVNINNVQQLSGLAPDAFLT